MSATETTETVTDTEETVETTPGVGGIVGENAPEPITTLDELVELIQTQRVALATSNHLIRYRIL